VKNNRFYAYIYIIVRKLACQCKKMCTAISEKVFFMVVTRGVFSFLDSSYVISVISRKIFLWDRPYTIKKSFPYENGLFMLRISHARNYGTTFISVGMCN
jgi:hypothetical protein